jgi:hypothetical protein
MKDLHGRWMKDEDYRKEYEALEGGFTRVQALIEARTQEEPATRIKISQSAVINRKV